jgi:hypothetical protein
MTDTLVLELLDGDEVVAHLEFDAHSDSDGYGSGGYGR